MLNSLLFNNLVWTEGLAIVGVFAVVSLLSLIIYRPFLYVIAIAFFATLYFFRNPTRICRAALNDERVLVCPADGKVVEITDDTSCAAFGCTKRVSIFLSPLDVHVNWIPSAGQIQEVIYRPGTFCLAYLPKSSELNERNDVVIACGNGQKLVVRQIAGAVARRICCWVAQGDRVPVGHKYGMIRFGSRVDILMPAQVALAVGLGQYVYGGETVLGRWSHEAHDVQIPS